MALAFIDFKKTFNIYKAVKVKLNVYDDDTPEFSTTKEYDKGTQYPELFTVILEHISRKLDWNNRGLSVDGEYLNFTDADDSILIDKNAEV